MIGITLFFFHYNISFEFSNHYMIPLLYWDLFSSLGSSSTVCKGRQDSIYCLFDFSIVINVLRISNKTFLRLSQGELIVTLNVKILTMSLYIISIRLKFHLL
jgi:hypothetical protein